MIKSVSNTKQEIRRLQKLRLEELIQIAKDYHPNPSTWECVAKVIKSEESIEKNKPNYAIRNPLTGKIIVYDNSRLKRPENHGKNLECQICNGNTTLVVLAGEGYPAPFINLNMFPYFHPNTTPLDEEDILIGGSFLEFLTTEHKEIHQISYEEHDSCLKLMKQFENDLGTKITYGIKEHPGHFSIFKNTGKNAGASLEHGHYQITFTNELSSSMLKDSGYLHTKRETFAKHIQNKAKEQNLIIKDYDSVQTIVPYFARIPLQAMIILKENVERIADIDNKILKDLSRATIDLTRCLYYLMPGLGKELAYNTIFHTGSLNGALKDNSVFKTGSPIGSLGRMYLEFSPFTQIYAGLEKIGIDVCQLDPKTSAKIYRNTIDKIPQNPNDYEISPNDEIAGEAFDRFVKPVLN